MMFHLISVEFQLVGKDSSTSGIFRDGSYSLLKSGREVISFCHRKVLHNFGSYCATRYRKLLWYRKLL